MIGIWIIVGVLLLICGMLSLSIAFFSLGTTCKDGVVGDIAFIFMMGLSISCIIGGLYAIGFDILSILGVI